MILTVFVHWEEAAGNVEKLIGRTIRLLASITNQNIFSIKKNLLCRSEPVFDVVMSPGSYKRCRANTQADLFRARRCLRASRLFSSVTNPRFLKGRYYSDHLLMVHRRVKLCEITDYR